MSSVTIRSVAVSLLDVKACLHQIFTSATIPYFALQKSILACLHTSLLWSTLLDADTRQNVASHMYERAVPAGDLLIQAGETGDMRQ